MPFGSVSAGSEHRRCQACRLVEGWSTKSPRKIEGPDVLRAFFHSEHACHSPWRLLKWCSCRPHFSACCRTIVSDRRDCSPMPASTFTIFSTAHWEQCRDGATNDTTDRLQKLGLMETHWRTYLSCPANVLTVLVPSQAKSASPSPKRRQIHPRDPRQKITAKAEHWRHCQSRQKSLNDFGDSSVNRTVPNVLMAEVMSWPSPASWTVLSTRYFQRERSAETSY